MKSAAFEYARAASVSEVCEWLREDGDNTKLIAGGQSLVPMMAMRLTRPARLININEIDALKFIRVVDGELVIGACVRHNAFERAVVDGPLGVLLKQVVPHIAHRPIRSRGTFCGSIAHADPASEWCVVAAALDAVMVAVSARGRREIPASEWFPAARTTALGPAEILESVRLPRLPGATRFAFHEFARRAGDFSALAEAAKARNAAVGYLAGLIAAKG